MGSQMITPRKFSCSQAKQQYGTGKRQLMMRWKLYCIRCFLIWCLGSKECSYSLENTPSNDIPYTTIQILNICVLFCSSWWKSPQGRSESRRKWGQSWQLRSTSTLGNVWVKFPPISFNTRQLPPTPVNLCSKRRIPIKIEKLTPKLRNFCRRISLKLRKSAWKTKSTREPQRWDLSLPAAV